MKRKYKRTLYASYLGYITQAIVNNLAPLLFVTFQKEFSITVAQIGFLVTYNFAAQMVVDILAAKYVEKIGYKVSILAAHIFAAAGLIGMGFLPSVLGNPYIGLLIAITIYAIGGGLIEVLVSPIVQALPMDEKSAAMSLLHAFYCWGHVLVVVLSTVYFRVVGIESWRFLTILWALVPIANIFVYAGAPIKVLVEEGNALPVKKLFSMKLFWSFFILMICSGAQDYGGSLRTLYVCNSDGCFQNLLWNQRRQNSSEKIYIYQQYPLCAELSRGCIFSKSGAFPCGLRYLRAFRGNYVAGSVQSGC